jgi:hypothetical protein
MKIRNHKIYHAFPAAAELALFAPAKSAQTTSPSRDCRFRLRRTLPRDSRKRMINFAKILNSRANCHDFSEVKDLE